MAVTAGLLSVRVDGDENWSAKFQLPSSLTQFQPGTPANLSRFPFHDPAAGGLSWSGEGRGCNTLRGWFVVDSVTYDAGGFESNTLRFQHNSEGFAPALRGKVSWAT